MRFSRLFEPISVGKVTIKNRIAMAPINNYSQANPADGTITERCVHYYVERARGGVGLIITGVFKVENEIERCINLKDGIVKWPLLTKKSLQQYTELANYVHSYGARIFIQLSAGPGRVTGADAIFSGVTPVSASANECYFAPNVTCRPLETKEVDRIIAAFGEAAEVAAIAGIDGVEVHGHEGYLIDQFTTALWNRRTDKYGGDLENRLRFPIGILRSIKDRVGKDFPVTYRYGVKHFIQGPWKSALRDGEKELGRDLEEAIAVAKLLEAAGYDGLHVDTGCYESSYWAHPPYYFPHGFALGLTSEIKKAVAIPVMVVGRLDCPEIAEGALAEGKADMIVLGRALLADPYWPEKVRKGDIDDIRPCLGCNEACLHRPSVTGAPLSCSVNPSCGRERDASVQPTTEPRKVLVVGGGVAGMECARVAGLRGHDVTLFERTETLGGHLVEASVPEFKADIRRLLDWYRRQLDKLGIRVELGTTVTPKLVTDRDPDAVVVATGSVPVVPKIPGVDNAMVATCCDLLLGKKECGNHVVVIGGGLEGCETALWLSSQGKRVIIVEMQSEVAADIHRANRAMLLDLLMDAGVRILTNTMLHEVGGGAITVVSRDLRVERIECDTVALGVGMKPNQDLYQSLIGEVYEVYLIGDAKQPRRIHDAIWEGWNIGRAL